MLDDHDYLEEERREGHEEWRNQIIFLPVTELDNIFDTYPECRIPKCSSWYAIVNNEQELVDLIKRVDGEHDQFVQNGIIKQVFIKDDDDDNIDDDVTVHVDEIEETDVVTYLLFDINEWFEINSQLQLEPKIKPHDPYRDVIVFTDASREDLIFPLMLNYYYAQGGDRIGKYEVNLTSLKPLHGVGPRSGKVKIHFGDLL